MHREALGLTPTSSVDSVEVRVGLSHTLRTAFQVRGGLDISLNEGIALPKSVRDARPSSLGQMEVMGNLACDLQVRYEQTYNDSDLERAIEYFERML